MLTKKAAYRSTDKDMTAKTVLDMPDELVDAQSSKEVQARCAQWGVHGVHRHHPSYHHKFARVQSPPAVMYRMGNISLLDLPTLALVGPRIPSSSVQDVTHACCACLQHYQVVTISGGADGVDHLAHQYSMEFGIPTIVVLGGGLRRYTQRSERQFFQQILAAGGLLLSERKLDFGPTHYTFPQRNRLIAGCANVVFVPGASLGSGSLITVDFALQFGIPVMTVPGPYDDPLYAGTNTYLCQRKIMGTIDFHDFLSQYFLPKQRATSSTSDDLDVLSDEERAVYALLSKKPLALSSLLHTVHTNMSELLAMLSCLELKNFAYSPESGYRARKK